MKKILVPFMALNAVIFCDAAEKTLPATTSSHQEDAFSRLLQEAKDAGNNGNFAKMRILLREARKAKPESPEPDLMDAKLFMMLGQFSDSRNALSDYLRKGGKEEDWVLLLSVNLDAHDDKYLDVIAKATKGIKSAKEESLIFEFRKLRLRSFIQIEDHLRAREDMNWFLKHNIDTPEFLLYELQLAFLERDRRKILKITERLLQMDQSELSQISSRIFKNPEVIVAICANENFWFHNYQRAFQICDSFLKNGSNDARLRYIRGRVSEKMGNLEKAFEDYKVYRVQKSTVGSTVNIDVVVSFHLLQNLLLMGRYYKDAENEFLAQWTLLDSLPKITADSVFMKIFMRHLQMNRWKDVPVNTISPESIQRSLGELEELAKKYPSLKGIEALKKRLHEAKIKGYSSELNTSLIDVWRENQSSFEGEYFLFLSQFMIVGNFGDILKKTKFSEKDIAEIGNIERMLKCAIAKKDGTAAEAFFILAQISYQRGLLDDALQNLSDALSLEKEYFDALALECEILQKQGKLTELIQTYETILKSFPNENAYKERLAKIKGD